MHQSQKRVRPGFLVGLLAFLAFFSWLISTGAPTEKDKIKAKRITTIFQLREVAALLKEKAFAIGGLTNISNKFVLDSIFVSQPATNLLSPRELREIRRQERTRDEFFKTNASGALLDMWQTPYRIELVGQTNFIIGSAGNNREFGDEDDLVYNSELNNYLKP